MADLGTYFASTVLTSTPQTLQVEDNTDLNKSRVTWHEQSHYQVSVSGAGSLVIGVKMLGQSVFVSLPTITNKVVILDLIDVEEFLLTASGADVPTIISPFAD